MPKRTHKSFVINKTFGFGLKSEPTQKRGWAEALHTRHERQLKMKRTVLCCIAVAIALVEALVYLSGGQKPRENEFINSVGIEMVRVPAGKFLMGDPNPPEQLTSDAFLLPDDQDERPGHEVAISYPFYISATEVTAQQYHRFQRYYEDDSRFTPYVTGVSWYDAVAFTRWLSKREHRPYRLPTEAEWEYACRAGATTPFPSGDQPRELNRPNAWGIENMEAGPPEWVLDWYGPYRAATQTDPVGPVRGFAKVVRGGGLMAPRQHPRINEFAPFYRRCANRASVAPSYHGMTPIGFRIVQASMPKTKPAPVHLPFFRRFVKATGSVPVKAGPDPRRPWFEQRDLLPIPPEDSSPQAIMAAGFHPLIQGHNHSPGLAVCPNGDVLAIFFSSSPISESLPNTAFVSSRLRFGSNQWDPPGVFMKFADVNNQSAMLWNDRGTINFFGGGSGLARVPFRWTWSKDSGATWNVVHLPTLIGPIGGYSEQPITSAFRGPHGTLYVATDGVGGHSLLWGSRDSGKTWFDTGGRTDGRHTAFVPLKDGCILGLGGKNTNIGGYMPESVSCDGGRTWNVKRSPFPALGSNQRPTVIRLADGKIFFASDFQNHFGGTPPGEKQRGAFVALSSDEGKTWAIKKLATALPHEMHVLPERPGWHVIDYTGDATLGYAVAAQAPDGIIYLISTMNHPAQEFEMNEAWILSKETGRTPMLTGRGKRIPGREVYPNGRVKARWTGKIEPDGRYELDGTATWYYSSGAKEYQVNYRDGVETGLETYWAADGHRIWQWDHQADGVSVWVHFWPNGRKRQESHWRHDTCFGTATLWNPAGAVLRRFQFHNGFLPH